MTPTIGVAIIAKNEEVLIGQCLESVKEADEIVVVDTGSKDRTMEAARLYTDKVYDDFKWNDSFCDARNHVKSKMTSSWILSLDCDEILHNYRAVREAVYMAEKKGSLAVDVTMIASDNGQKFIYPRLFKNDPKVFWLGNIHNHLSVLGGGISDIRITHGYSPAHILDPDRAIRILKKDVDLLGDKGVREMFYLGREYYYRNDYGNCLKMLKRYVRLSAYFPEKAEAFLIMARTYWTTGRGEQARKMCMNALICNANFKEAIVFMAILTGKGSGNTHWENNGASWLRMAEQATNEDVLFIRKEFDFR